MKMWDEEWRRGAGFDWRRIGKVVEIRAHPGTVAQLSTDLPVAVATKESD